MTAVPGARCFTIADVLAMASDDKARPRAAGQFRYILKEKS